MKGLIIGLAALLGIGAQAEVPQETPHELHEKILVETILEEEILEEEIMVEEIIVNSIEVRPIEVKPIEITSWDSPSVTRWD